jgi:superfamily II DNA helicase RecQ
MRYTETSQCRMSALVRHFGDHADGARVCGICDFCAPQECIAQQFRDPSDEEKAAARAAVDALKSGPPRSTGKLYTHLFPDERISRDAFEEVLSALAREGLAHIADAVFEKDGKSIPFRRVSLSRDGQDLPDGAEITFTLKEVVSPATRRRKKSKKSSTKAAATAAKSGEKKAPRRASKKTPSQPAAAESTPPAPRATRSGQLALVIDGGESNAALEAKLRAWRLAEAKKHGVPAFKILKDQTIRAIAANPPNEPNDLLSIPGIGASTLKKYGAAICKLCAR